MCPRFCITRATFIFWPMATWPWSRPTACISPTSRASRCGAQIQHVTWDPIMAEKGGFKHFMLKEIYEQPRAVRDTTLGRVSQDTGHIFLDEMRDQRGGIARGEKDQHHCLRDELACRAGRQVHDRNAGARAGGSGLRQRMALSQSDCRSGHDHAGDFAVGRNGGHDRGAARSEVERIEDAGHLQRGWIDDHARGRRDDLHACRAGDWRGLDQGVYGTTHGAVHLRDVSGAGARDDDCGAGRARRCRN